MTDISAFLLLDPHDGLGNLLLLLGPLIGKIAYIPGFAACQRLTGRIDGIDIDKESAAFPIRTGKMMHLSVGDAGLTDPAMFFGKKNGHVPRDHLLEGLTGGIPFPTKLPVN